MIKPLYHLSDCQVDRDVVMQFAVSALCAGELTLLVVGARHDLPVVAYQHSSVETSFHLPDSRTSPDAFAANCLALWSDGKGFPASLLG